MNTLDLFAGAGGLSEGFQDANIIAKIEKDRAACETLIVRGAYHDLKKTNKLHIYDRYLSGEIDKEELLDNCNEFNPDTILNEEINDGNLKAIFEKIDLLMGDVSLDAIIGGPPCQAYSLIGRARNSQIKSNDERIYLYEYYLKFLERYNPNFFIFENVKGLLSFKDIDKEPLFDKIIKSFTDIGYNIEYKVLDASHFGVPQKRERLFIIGYKDLKLESFFDYLDKFKVDMNLSINDLFEDLPNLNAGELDMEYSGPPNEQVVNLGLRREDVSLLTQHSARQNNSNDLKIYKIASELKAQNINVKYSDLPKELQTHKNKESFLDRFKAIDGQGISHTITAHIAKDGHHFIHPDLEQNRSITVREAARIQTFPDDYYFENSRTSAFRQIGNAVPPALSKILFKAIKEKAAL